jgi:uncharacterized MAPEG superfamily protein
MTMLLLAIIVGIVQLFLAATIMTKDRGTAWNAGPRDEPGMPLGKMAGRLDRAFMNFKETFPFFAAAVLACTVTGRIGATTAWGAELYVLARILYVPAYAFGLTGVRSLIFMASAAGIIAILVGLASQ